MSCCNIEKYPLEDCDFVLTVDRRLTCYEVALTYWKLQTFDQTGSKNTRKNCLNSPILIF